MRTPTFRSVAARRLGAALVAARRLGAALAVLSLVVAPASATWSIVVVDTATGEVGIASATCVQIDLRRYLAVVVPGQGVAAAQSVVDSTGANRLLIWNGIQNGLTPVEILAALAAQDGQHNSRQYGIATLLHDPLTWHGTGVGQARHGLSGQAGSLRYAVQGNLLTGAVVVERAVEVLLETDGDLGQKLMAAMRAAARLGGDGRCSCSGLFPTSCGAPPPSFTKSSHVAFITVARLGDSLGVCSSSLGCANGIYYLNLQQITGPSGVDPVVALSGVYASWRLGRLGRPDHILTSVETSGAALVADGSSSKEVIIEVRDVDGNVVGGTGTTFQIALAPGSPPVATVGPVTPLGQGRYRFTVRATAQPGEGSVRIVVDDPTGQVQLYPDLALRVDPLAELHAGFRTLSAAVGADVPWTLNLGPASAGRPYILLGSASGSHPGQVLGGLWLPLNPDAFFDFTLSSANGPSLPGSRGYLDASGRATARYLALPGDLAPFVGHKLTWAAAIGGPGPFATHTVELLVRP